jgi:hypothetical protein
MLLPPLQLYTVSDITKNLSVFSNRPASTMDKGVHSLQRIVALLAFVLARSLQQLSVALDH